MFSKRFILFPTYKKNPVSRQKLFFLEKQFFLISFYVLCYFQHEQNIGKLPLHLYYWLNGRWFLLIVDKDSGNLYPIYPLFPCSDFLSQMWGGGIFFAFYAISKISRRKKVLGIHIFFF